MAAAEGQSYFCPLQHGLGDVNIAWVDIRGGGRQFKKTIKMLKEREKQISPFFVEVGGFRVHVTPLNNPKFNGSSYHIIRLFDSKDSQYHVDLLIQDTDLYFVGFRRQKNGVWSEWFTFEDTDKEVDIFLGGTTKIEMSMRHPEAKSCVTPGGSKMAFREIFMEFIHFPKHGRVSNAFKRAAFSVMVIFCEVRRLRSLCEEIYSRIDNQLPPHEITDCQFGKMHKWGSASGIVLEANKEKTLALGTPLSKDWKELNLNYIGCLIGGRAELLLLKFNRRYVPLSDFEFENLQKDPRSAMVPDRDFILLH